MWLTDERRAALMALAQAVFPVGQIFGFWDFTGDEVAQIMGLIGAVTIFIGLAFKQGQGTTVAKSTSTETVVTESSEGN